MAENVKHLNDENFFNEVNSGITLVDFYADWCGPCKMIAPIIEELANEMDGKVNIAKVDVDKAQQVTASFQVTSIPTLILFKNGSEFKRVVGLKDKDALKTLINTAL